MAIIHCRDCVYWDEDFGVCRRRAPTVPPWAEVPPAEVKEARWQWPPSEKDDWCGEGTSAETKSP